MTSLSGPQVGAVDQIEAGASAPPPQARGARRKVASGEGRLALFLIGPAIVLLAAVVGYPIFFAVYHSLLSDKDLSGAFFEGGGKFVGLDHYINWVTQKCTVGGQSVSCPSGNIGAQFWTAIGTTVFYTVVTVILETIIGMIMALMMHKAFKGRGLVRAAILVPWAIPTAITAKLWVVIFDQNGVFNKVLGTNFAWTTTTWPGRFAIIIADVWKTTPFMALLILAGLQLIPEDIYESAKVDGATAWQRFVRITLPLARPAIAVAVIFRSMDVLRMFDLPYILTPGAPGTDTISVLVVKQLRTPGVNSAAAISSLAFIFIFLCAFLLIRLLGTGNIVASQAKGAK